MILRFSGKSTASSFIGTETFTPSASMSTTWACGWSGSSMYQMKVGPHPACWLTTTASLCLHWQSPRWWNTNLGRRLQRNIWTSWTSLKLGSCQIILWVASLHLMVLWNVAAKHDSRKALWLHRANAHANSFLSFEPIWKAWILGHLWKLVLKFFLAGSSSCFECESWIWWKLEFEFDGLRTPWFLTWGAPTWGQPSLWSVSPNPLMFQRMSIIKFQWVQILGTYLKTVLSLSPARRSPGYPLKRPMSVLEILLWWRERMTRFCPSFLGCLWSSFSTMAMTMDCLLAPVIYNFFMLLPFGVSP